jgi:uncharacterized protein with HEPN domain
VYLYDIVQAAANLQEFIQGRTLEDYAQSLLLRSAVERQFITIGEALHRALRMAPELERRISNAQRVIGFRNRLIHGYALTDDDIVRNALQVDLPVLRREVSAWLDELDEAEG